MRRSRPGARRKLRATKPRSSGSLKSSKRNRNVHIAKVFSTDPITNVLAQIQDRLPVIQKEAGVVALVSKWDKSALRKHGKAERIDVTDRLAAEFKPGEKQLKMIEEIKRAKPVSPSVADKHDH